jgi:ABC-2 type transport system permease protein
MRLLSLYGGALVGTMRRDAHIFLSYRLRVLTGLATEIFGLAIFYYTSKIVRPDAVGAHGQYFTYVVIGITAMAVLEAALSSGQVIRMQLMQGNFERVLISPFGPVWGVIAVIAFPILYAMTTAIVTLALAVVIFGISLHLTYVVPAIGVGLLGSVSLACIGLLFVAALLAFKSALGSNWVIAGLGFLGGAYFPLRLFPGWIRWVSYVQPFTPTIDLLRHLLIQTPTLESTGLEVVKLVGFTIVLLPIAYAALHLGVGFSRRRGTLMEF